MKEKIWTKAVIPFAVLISLSSGVTWVFGANDVVFHLCFFTPLFRLVLCHELSVKKTCILRGWSSCFFTNFTTTVCLRGWSSCFFTNFTTIVCLRRWSYCSFTSFTTIDCLRGWSNCFFTNFTTIVCVVGPTAASSFTTIFRPRGWPTAISLPSHHQFTNDRTKL
jgi:hypothetical protein